jgi:hypothetical protein
MTELAGATARITTGWRLHRQVCAVGLRAGLAWPAAILLTGRRLPFVSLLSALPHGLKHSRVVGEPLAIRKGPAGSRKKSWDRPKGDAKDHRARCTRNSSCRGVALGNNTQRKNGQKLANALTSTNMVSSGLTLSLAHRGVGSQKPNNGLLQGGKGTRTVRESRRYRGWRGRKDKK